MRFILILFLILLIANIIGGVYFASKWDSEKIKDNAPNIVYIILLIAVLVVFVLLLPFLSKFLIAFINFTFKDFLVIAYISLIIFLSILLITDWGSLENTEFFKSWIMLLFVGSPIMMLLIMLGIIYYSYKSGSLEKLLLT